MTKPNRHAPRNVNMKRLVAGLLKGEMSTGDCGRLLGMSASGTRGYTHELVKLQVAVERIGGLSSRTPFYRIHDRDRAAAYLAMLDAPETKADLERLAPSVPAFKAPDPDPFALSKDFFKPSTEFLERRSVPRVEQPRPTGFDALTVHFARVPA